ncbi:MAG: L,D-transpeptidase [Bacteroidetes Order II. Incertae sedis bacterium]|nr:L,D-transpeptidase [Bacteroidetes Order II. bacterium]
MIKKLLFVFSCGLMALGTVYAQDPEVNLEGLERAGLDSLYSSMRGDVQKIPDVKWDVHLVTETSTLMARLNLYEKYGINKIDVPSRRAQALIKLLNRNDLKNLQKGDSLFIPQPLHLDFRAYAPFERLWPAADKLDQLLLVDKTNQAFAAYEKGKLTRWGLVVTGKDETPTPTGRFNVNWKQPSRISTLSPALQKPKKGKKPSTETWFLKYVMNIHESRGIHFHQYFMPTTGPASHGCIRLGGQDARWLYAWTQPWETTVASDSAMVCHGTRCKVKKQGTPVLVLHKDPKGTPSFFTRIKGEPGVRVMPLPKNPYAVPAGTPQQQAFDQLRLAEERRIRLEAQRAASPKAKPAPKPQPQPKTKQSTGKPKAKS